MAEGNRKDPRARVLNMTVRYKSATVDEFIENHSHDISRGGIFIKTRSPFPAGTLLKFEVRIAEDQKLMHGVGRVVWRREADRAEESFPAGMGIKFIKTGEGAAELINQLILARDGAESSFDAGVREAVSAPGAARPSVVPAAVNSGVTSGVTAGVAPAAKPSSTPPSSGPALSVESGPRSLPSDGGTAVTNPPKKRQDLPPEKRKVVLQGPALESPPSKPRPLVTPAASADERAPSRERPARGSIAEETTAPRARAASVTNSERPRLSGLLVILGLIALIVFVVSRLRSPAAEVPGPAPIVAAEPEVPVPSAPPAPVEAVLPNEPAAPPVDPNAPAAVEPVGEPAAISEGAEAAATNPSATDLNAAGATSPAQPTPGAAPPVAGASVTAPQAPATPAPVTAKPPAPAPAPPTPKAVTPAPAKPAPPKPAPAAPKPQPAPAQAAPSSDSAEPAPPSAPSPTPPSATRSGGESSGATPPTKRPPAAAEPTAPPAPPPAPPPTATTPSDDNPY